jgi:hypothetical protein
MLYVHYPHPLATILRSLRSDSENCNPISSQVESPTATRTPSHTAARRRNGNIIGVVTRRARTRQYNQVCRRACSRGIGDLDRHALCRRTIVRELDIVRAGCG